MMLFTEESVIFPDILRPDKCYNVVVKSTGVWAIFWRGAGSILPEKYGAAPEK